MRDSFEFDVRDFEDPNNNTGVYARFYWVSREDPVKSAAEGRPVHVDKEYVEIVAAGNQNNIIRKPASDVERNRFREAYAKFKAGDTEQLTGTPLTEVPWISRSQVDELMYRKVRTLEQLAALNDNECNVPGMYELKRKAGLWLEKAKEAAPFTAMASEIDALRAELDAMKNQQLAAQQAKVAPKQG